MTTIRSMHCAGLFVAVLIMVAPVYAFQCNRGFFDSKLTTFVCEDLDRGCRSGVLETHEDDPVLYFTCKVFDYGCLRANLTRVNAEQYTFTCTEYALVDEDSYDKYSGCKTGRVFFAERSFRWEFVCLETFYEATDTSPPAGCLGSSTFIRTPEANKPIREIRINDTVSDGEGGWTRVIGFFHGPRVVRTFQIGDATVTSHHLVWYNDKWMYGKDAGVRGRLEVVFAPITASGTIGTAAGQKLSSYAYFPQWLSHAYVQVRHAMFPYAGSSCWEENIISWFF